MGEERGFFFRVTKYSRSAVTQPPYTQKSNN